MRNLLAAAIVSISFVSMPAFAVPPVTSDKAQLLEGELAAMQEEIEHLQADVQKLQDADRQQQEENEILRREMDEHAMLGGP